MGFCRRKTVTRLIACLLVTIAVVISRQDDTQDNYSMFESEEGILFFSDDESQDHIVASLSDSETMSDEDSADEFVESDEKRPEKAHRVTESHEATISRSQIPSVTKQKPAFDKPKYEYLQLPEVYRVNVTAKALSNKPNLSSKQAVTPKTSNHSVMGDQTSPWVRKFLSSHPHDLLLPVPRDFCMDNFNLVHIAPAIERIGIQSMASGESIPVSSKPFPIYREALRLIVQDDPLPDNTPLYLQNAAKALYLLIHQRYAVSPRGLDMIRRRFIKNASIDPIFGRCPRIRCCGMPLLPHADSDNLNPMEYLSFDQNTSFLSSQMTRRAKRYCASCGETFYHWQSEVDGCAWGTSCCHLFLMVFGSELFVEWLGWKPHSQSEARIFGFRLHPSAYDTQTRLWNM